LKLLRFVIPDRDRRTGQPMGLLTLAYQLLRSNDLTKEDDHELRRLVTWMETQVPIPSRFARKRNVSHKETHGISWMKADAAEAIRHLHHIADIVRRYGYPVDILQTERPGYVVHEDAWQVVAEPFHGEQG
jgi:hypothetical protein